MEIRKCKTCFTEKPLEQFAKSGEWYRHMCKKCFNALTAARNNAKFKADPILYANHKASMRGLYQNFVRKVLDHYGAFCSCCGETEEKFLTVDHIEPIGSLKNRIKAGHQGIYGWLVRSEFPPGFRLLCSNCNYGRHRNGGVCPHQEGSQTRAQARSRIGGEIPEVRQDRNIVGATVKAVDVPKASLEPWGLQ